MHRAERTAPELAIPPHEDAEDEANFQSCMEIVRARARGEVEGIYGPESMNWLLTREPTMLFGLAPAVVLQMAHPAIASGVAQHSDYRNDSLGRLRRTLGAMYTMTFGTLSESLAASRRIYRIHRRVRGTIEGTNTPYRANQQELLRWVAITTAYNARAAFERFVRPLDEDEKRRTHEELILNAASSCVLPSNMPETLEAFDALYQTTLESDELRVTKAGRDIVDSLFSLVVSGGPLGRIITAGLLPPRWREAFGLPWGRWERQGFDAFVKATRASRVVARPPYRYVPAWHLAMRRVTRARAAA